MPTDLEKLLEQHQALMSDQRELIEKLQVEVYRLRAVVNTLWTAVMGVDESREPTEEQLKLPLGKSETPT